MIMDYSYPIKKIDSNISSCNSERNIDVYLDKKCVYSEVKIEEMNLLKGKINYLEDINTLFKGIQNSSSENQQNDIKLNLFNERTLFFISLLKDTDFEDGYENSAVAFFKNMLNENYAIAFIWINNLYINNIDNEDIIEKILRILSFLKYDETTMASFPILAANAIMMGSDNVKEAAIMAFEAWRTPKCLGLLKKLKVEKEWLRSYLRQVVNELEQEALLC